MTRTDWTDEEMLRVLTLRDAGKSFSQIGAMIGRTKNAVIGMVHKIERDMAAAQTIPSIIPRAGMPPQTATTRQLPRPSIAAVGGFSGAW